ncbi:Na+/H+ antiporter subunit E [Ehrlichia canis]|uniref:Uncharacterized protein n=1 Tax=Ehrlichia canis (strain Jake) TaxID=269484 RepID=A0ACA6AVC6_EHRCJ|nr:Na+/H+ antiporter subunit E [Ehrlichia canis]AAZ68226.1 protein of unknown function DUF68 [Ehrlichia canis str. Jake]AUO55009.1 sodium:proton antiporter [Ehrlichia canis]UKC53686.1 sodium:proton antiporter [Ehrlichia canis]UKC54624.1 sodium:proton antiporter [Ehrlichia canis]UKC55560.1 sodium:proton antiporter [Ehrlichia canis]
MKKFFILFIFWLTLSGYFDLFFITLGAVSCITTLLITRILKNAIPSNENYIYHQSRTQILHFLSYFSWLIQQVILSNIHIIKKVWNFRTRINPSIFKVIQTKQTTGLNALIVANSITFTPGTVSIDVTDTTPYKITVLAIDEESMSGVVDIDNKATNL